VKKLPGAEYIRSVNHTIQDFFAPRILVPAIAIVLLWLLVLEPGTNLRSLEYFPFGWLYTFAIAAMYWAMAVVLIHFVLCWRSFRLFLQFLEKKPFRYAFSRLEKQISQMPLLQKIREQPLYFSSRSWDCLKAIQELEIPDKDAVLTPSLAHLSTGGAAAAAQPHVKPASTDRMVRIPQLIQECEQQRAKGKQKLPEYAELQGLFDFQAIQFLQEFEHSRTNADLSDSLRNEQMRATKKTAPDEEESLLILKEELIVLRYLIYIRYVLRHLRNLLGFLVGGFILSVVSLESYYFQGDRSIDITSALTFVALGTTIVIVFAQMEKDAILSRIKETQPNQIGRNFYFELARFGTLPLITLLASQFPSISRFLFSWLQPALESLH
jgi:hypothetical protein